MRFLKRFERFNEEFVTDIENNGTKPAPTTKPATPTTKPGTRPGRPSPIRRDKPSVDPRPKAEIPTATPEDVVNKFISLLNDNGEDVKKYVEEK